MRGVFWVSPFLILSNGEARRFASPPLLQWIATLDHPYQKEDDSNDQ
jgi:hypothetical protein